ncbi:MAG: STAS domain-containing protein [Actinomycetota bacterium]
MTRSTFESSIDDGRAVVAANGQLDLSTTPALERAIGDAIDGTSGALTLDLRGLRFIDSTGLRLVLITDARMRDLGRPFRVTEGPDQVHHIFELAVLKDRLAFVDGNAIEVEAEP